ncbi:hypothetical protein [Saccharibacillus alkalitolerans]|uniref:Uncharacterized protein n=1 Tax=Saccharibacillus alkalitolerans TaxID=2705290 RepID=A0ABX0F118_9BACL|nr:hypothetical protein [Saccharibacillus alkalitolerans]NGZ74661.1 hypothetical protein [Saccharibacillus alkalitolerans]
MANEGRPEDTEFMTKEEREEAGRRTNADFARHERTESEKSGANDVSKGPILKRLAEDDIRRRVGDGNFDASKGDDQTPSINS